MNIITTEIEGCFIIEPKIIRDGRGYFMESFHEGQFNELTGANVHFVQDNQSFSSKGVVRGLHFQKGAHSQSKLVRVITGAVLDVAVDIRPGSPTFGKYVSAVLTAENMKQMFVPRGFAHGFSVLEDNTTFFYKCDNYYNKESEAGIKFNDPEINIDWQMPHSDFMVSERDQSLPRLAEAEKVW